MRLIIGFFVVIVVLLVAAVVAVTAVLRSVRTAAGRSARVTTGAATLGRPPDVVGLDRSRAELGTAPAEAARLVSADRGTTPDGAAPDGAAPDGAALDGAALDGAALDGAALDGAAPDRSAPDRARGHGPGGDVPGADRAGGDGAGGDGVVAAGVVADGTTAPSRPDEVGHPARPSDQDLVAATELAARAAAAGQEAAELLAAARAEADQIGAAAQAAARAAAGAVDQDRQRLVVLTAQLEARQADVASETRQVRDDLALRRTELERREQRLDERERRLTSELERSEHREVALDTRDAALTRAEEDAEAVLEEHRTELERIADLTAEQARGELLAAAESDSRRAAALIARDIEGAARADAERNARRVITIAIQRLASQQTSESVVSLVSLPADDMKGRIIGREGRNIRAFEQVTGVNVIIDDTPDAVLISCFDPVRREVARITLEALIADGRIHPHRIEELHEIAVREVEVRCRRAADDAMLEVGITDLHPELVTTLGHLRYRTSYGQNVLGHLVECAHLAGLMAAELGIDPVRTRRCAFLHDIGKALTHQVEGSHALVGADLARRFGEHPDVVHAIEAHHGEVEPRTVEALLTQAADAISGSRPGARRESLEAYVKRLRRLEEIGLAHPGVDKVFAMQAGREVKVMVLPEHVDDLQAQVMAREIVKEIEDELTFPGQIRVTVIRESRATEIAR